MRACQPSPENMAAPITVLAAPQVLNIASS